MRLCPKLTTQFHEGKGYEELEQLKSFSLKIQGTTSSVAITERKGKQYVRQIMYINQRHYLQKLPLLLTLQVNQPFSVMFQLLEIIANKG